MCRRMKEKISSLLKNALFITVASSMVFLVVIIIYGTDIYGKGNICLSDYVVYFEYYGFEEILLFPILFFLGIILKADKRDIVIIRYGSVRKFWKALTKRIAVFCFEISFLITGIIFLMIIIIKKICIYDIPLYNWNDPNSRFAYVSGNWLKSDYNIFIIMLCVFLEIFTVLFVCVLIIEYIEWITNIKVIGMLVCVIFVCLEKYSKLTSLLFEIITLMPCEIMVKYGITVKRCILYPILICLILWTLTYLTIKRRDIGKEKHWV